MLELSNITLTYPDGDTRLTAINDVSLNLPAGTFAAITGPSGSGKSSLLSVAATLVSPDSGTISIGGHDVTGASLAERAAVRRNKLGVVFQAPNLIPSLSVAEQLEIMARISGGEGSFGSMNARDRRAHILTLLDEVGMKDMADRKPGQLSGGQRQRVNIARAIVHSPQVLLVDEPTSALDSERSAAVIDLLENVTREHNLATAVVTHDEEQLPQFDVAFHMVDGRLTERPTRQDEHALKDVA